MKIRTDFVSNSSSSSMIIANCAAFRKNDITKQMLFDAIVDLYGKDNYEKCRNQYDFEPFQIYDLSNKDDRIKAHAKYDGILSGWCSNYVYKDYETGECYAVKNSTSSPFESFRTIVEELNKLKIIDSYRCENPDEILESKRYNRTTKQYEPVPEYVKKLLLEVWDRSGIMTNSECLDVRDAKFFIHFSDNEIMKVKGFTDIGKKDKLFSGDSDYAKKHNEAVLNSTWTTESMSIERFYEILIKYFAEKLDLFYPNEINKLINHWSKLTITFCGHEG